MYKLTMIADLHHFSNTLSDGGRAYQLRSSSDQKCLEETGAIIDAAFKKIAESDCDAVLIAGDLSNDGEKVAHEEVKKKIDVLAEKKPVYIVYATHDWCCDGNAKRFEGDKYYNDVETMTPPQLREFYKDYGEKQAYSTFVNHLGAASYAVKLSDKVRLIGVNDDQDGKGHSGYADDHFEWILEQVKDAKAKGEAVIIMEHHLLLSNISMLVNQGQIIGEHDERAEALAQAGADFVIVGHSHMQRTTSYVSKDGKLLTQINLGSLCGHPAPITTLTITDEEYKIDVDYLEKFTYNGKEYDREFIKAHSQEVLTGLLNAAVNDKEDFLDRLSAIGVQRESVEKYYGILRRVSKYALNVTVGKAGRLVNFFTFGKGVDKKAVKAIKDDNLMDHIMDIFLSVFDGSIKSYDTSDPVYIIVHDVATLPKRASKVLKIKALRKDKIQKIFGQIEEIAEELTNPSAPNNQHHVIKRT